MCLVDVLSDHVILLGSRMVRELFVMARYQFLWQFGSHYLDSWDHMIQAAV